MDNSTGNTTNSNNKNTQNNGQSGNGYTPPANAHTFGGGGRRTSIWMWLFIGFAIIFLWYMFFDDSGTKPTGVSNSQFIDYIISGEITEVVRQGNTYYGYKDNGPVTNNEFSRNLNNAKYSTYYTGYEWSHEFFSAVTGVYEDQPVVRKVAFDTYVVPTSWTEWIWPIIYILGFAILIFFLFRMFNGKGGISQMGKNRARVVFNSQTRFADVAGIEEEKKEVEEIVEFLRNPRKFINMGARIPKGFLLVGSPGTGKTLLAKAIAGEAGVPFFSISGSDFSEMLVGVGPSRMRDLFETAKLNAPCIIFIDEIDSIARMRGVGASGVSDENEQTLNQLLVQMDGFTKSEGVIVLAATNRPDVLDQALLRPGRFDRQIIVQIPDVKGRQQILAVHAKNKPISEDVDLAKVAKIISGFSGADIENLMNESAILAARKNHAKITMGDITEGINKVLLGPQKRSRITTEQDKKVTAFHESGHAVISKLLEQNGQIAEVSIIPRGRAAGYTLTNEVEERSHISRKDLINRLVMLLGGRAAEQIMVGDICTGSHGDLKIATNIATKMTTDYGMSKKLGAVYFGQEDEIALRMYNDKHRSEAIQSVIDGEVKSFIEDAEKTALELITKHKSKVQVMADVLLEKETIYSEDVALIMDGKNAKEVIAEMEVREVKAKERQEKEAKERAEQLEKEESIAADRIKEVMKKAGIKLEDTGFNVYNDKKEETKNTNEKNKAYENSFIKKQVVDNTNGSVIIFRFSCFCPTNLYSRRNQF
ncbi:MAG: ATP-dependent zinc metalloprotease FtsH [Firmicutes bacterium]|nr:ATP-dependent zinc metalloprotease FtsH [Bacillota bacterium]